MKPVYTKIIIVVLIVGMFIGMIQSYDKEACEQVLCVANDFSQAIIARDSEKVLELTSSAYNKKNTEGYFDNWDFEEAYSLEKAELLECIQDTLTFEVHSGTVDASTKYEYGEVDVYFSVMDYDRVYADQSNLINYGMLRRELRSEEGVKVFRVTLTFVYEDGEWRVSNFKDVYNAVYSFLNINVSFPNLVRRAVLGGHWCFTVSGNEDKDHYYVDTPVIDMDLVLSPDVPNVDWSSVYYTVSMDGEVLYTSDPGTLEGYFGEEQEAELNEDGLLVPGEYTISFYDEYDYLLYYDSATVDISSDVHKE